MAVLAVDPESQGIALDCIAPEIVVWAIIDLGILEGKAADCGPVAALVDGQWFGELLFGIARTYIEG
jgi:hypothetical protein